MINPCSMATSSWIAPNLKNNSHQQHLKQQQSQIPPSLSSKQFQDLNAGVG